MEIGYLVSIWLLPVLVAITFHEAAHGYVAWRLGDDTAKQLGRVTFNPLKHIDLFGTILLPAMLIFASAPLLFGWAKPVPVNFYRLDNPRRDMVWVAAAGPAINIVLAVVSALLIHAALVLPDPIARWAFQNLQNSILINLVLAAFNMIPLPPLDGGRVVMFNASILSNLTAERSIFSLAAIPLSISIDSKSSICARASVASKCR